MVLTDQERQLRKKDYRRGLITLIFLGILILIVINIVTAYYSTYQKKNQSIKYQWEVNVLSAIVLSIVN